MKFFNEKCTKRVGNVNLYLEYFRILLLLLKSERFSSYYDIKQLLNSRNGIWFIWFCSPAKKILEISNSQHPNTEWYVCLGSFNCSIFIDRKHVKDASIGLEIYIKFILFDTYQVEKYHLGISVNLNWPINIFVRLCVRFFFVVHSFFELNIIL